MKYPHYSLFALLLLLLASQVSAYEQQSINITVNGKQRNMVVFTPNTLPEKSPLFIVTHGMNQDPEYQYGSDKLYELIDTAKFVVTYLRSDGNTWDIGGTNDQNFVSKTIAATFPSEIIGCRDVAVAAHESTPELDSENLIRIED